MRFEYYLSVQTIDDDTKVESVALSQALLGCEGEHFIVSLPLLHCSSSSKTNAFDAKSLFYLCFPLLFSHFFHN